MKVTNEKTENRQAFLTIELEPEEVEKSLDKSYKQVVKKVNIPGFRKGKAPRDIVERYVGREGLLDEAVKDMIPEAYEKAVTDEGLEPVAQPEIDIDSIEPFIFKAVIPLKPEVTLGAYKDVRIEEEKAEVTEEQVNELIENLRHQHALWEPVERPAELNDEVIFNIKSDVDGLPFINRLGAQYQLSKEQTFPVEGFAEQLVGAKIGETREFKLKLPDDFTNTDMSGKDVSFEVTINEIKEEKLPELNDEFATQVGGEFKNLEDLRSKAMEELTRQTEDDKRKEYEQKIIDEVVKTATIEYPPAMLESEIDRLVREQLQRYNLPDDKLNDYLKAINKTNEQLREEIKPQASKNLVEAIILGEVATAENVDFTEEEVDAEVDKMIGAVSEENKETIRQYFNTPDSRQSIRRMYIGRRTVDKLVEIAKGEAGNAEPVEEEKNE